MIFCTTKNSIVQFITVTLIFIIVLVITYFTTKWMGSYQKKSMSVGNIKVIDSCRLSSSKVLEIVKAGGKCFLIAICKDTVTLIGEVDEMELEDRETKTPAESFGSVFNRFKLAGKEEAKDETEK